MARLDLLIREIEDPYVRENMVRLARYLDRAVFANMESVTIEREVEKDKDVSVQHSLGVVPNVLLILSKEGDGQVSFSDVTKDDFVLRATGDLKIRLLIGRSA